MGNIDYVDISTSSLDVFSDIGTWDNELASIPRNQLPFNQTSEPCKKASELCSSNFSLSSSRVPDQKTADNETAVKNAPLSEKKNYSALPSKSIYQAATGYLSDTSSIYEMPKYVTPEEVFQTITSLRGKKYQWSCLSLIPLTELTSKLPDLLCLIIRVINLRVISKSLPETSVHKLLNQVYFQ